MSSGIIIQHLWPEQTHELERQVHNNIMKFISDLPKNIPLLSYDIRIKEFSDGISKNFVNSTTFYEKDLSDQQIKEIIRSWILKNNLKNIYVLGLHFNLCIMQTTTKLKEICEEEHRSWCNDFIVKVVEECTLSINKDGSAPCRLEDTVLGMSYELSKPWLISGVEVLDYVH
jgi:hypothetical protein